MRFVDTDGRSQPFPMPTQSLQVRCLRMCYRRLMLRQAETKVIE